MSLLGGVDEERRPGGCFYGRPGEWWLRCGGLCIEGT